MKPKNLLSLAALLLLASLSGCASIQPTTANSADEEDEYEGRLFSWKFEAEPDQTESAKQPSAIPASTPNNTRPAKQPRRVTYSAEDDENGDRGFIIHGAGASDDDDE